MERAAIGSANVSPLPEAHLSLLRKQKCEVKASVARCLRTPPEGANQQDLVDYRNRITQLQRCP